MRGFWGKDRVGCFAVGDDGVCEPLERGVFEVEGWATNYAEWYRRLQWVWLWRYKNRGIQAHK